MSLKDFKGVIAGDQVQELFELAKKHQFALPAVNIIGTNSINAVMETAKAVNSPVIVQLSNGGAQFYAGKSLKNDALQACILGGISAAQHVHLVAEHYGVGVILHTDHCAKKLLPWLDGLLDAGEKLAGIVKISVIFLTRFNCRICRRHTISDGTFECGRVIADRVCHIITR